MYFILSKLLIFLLCPLFWVFALLLITAFIKNTKRRRRLFILSLVVFYVFSCPLVFNFVAALWNVDERPPANKTYSCAIVLGGFASFGKNGEGYFNGAADRFIQGIELLSSGRATHLMITGGNGHLINNKGHYEGDWVKQQLEILHFADSSLLIENRSRNTIENATFSKPILQKAQLRPPYLLVTSDFHMRRALMIFKKAGYNVQPYTCNYTAGQSDFDVDQLLPDPNALSGWNTYFKEFVGYVVDGWKKY